MTDHASDCAQHNMPAMEQGPCDCGAEVTNNHTADCEINNPAVSAGPCDCGVGGERILDAAKLIRQAADFLEAELKEVENGTRRWAEMRIAWDNLFSAHGLLTTGRMTPESLLWGFEVANKHVEAKTNDATPR